MSTQRILKTAAVAMAAVVAGSLPACSTVSGWFHREPPVQAQPAPAPGFVQSVSLSGANEVPSVETKATGYGSIIVNPDHSVIANIAVTGMTATAAHIHMAAAGANGPVIVPFTKTGDNAFAAPSDAKMTDEQYVAFKAGNTYVNVHSDAHKGGEIRAQLKGPGN